MQAHESVQLAAFIATHGSRLVHSRAPLPDAALELYWTASKCRLDRWSRSIKSLATVPLKDDPFVESRLEACDPRVLDEILLSEVLSRVWVGVCRASDRCRGSADAEPVSASVLAGHLEARNRVLNLMVYGHGIGVEHAVALNRRRTKYEYWTDLLLAQLARLGDVSDLAFEPRRLEQSAWGVQNHYGTMLGLAWATAAFWNVPRLVTGNEDLNRKIACAIVGCLPTGIFDSVGSIGSIRYLSMWQASPDVQGRPPIPARDDARRLRGGRWDSP